MNINLKIIALVFLIVFLIYPAIESQNHIIFDPLPKKYLNNTDITSTPHGKSGYVITDLSYQGKSNPLYTDLVLSFNYGSAGLQNDDNKRYKIRHADYDFSKENGSLGAGCAKFFKKNQRVEIEPARNLWLGSCGDLGSFTIEFMFKVFSNQENSEIFSRMGYLSGKKSGIMIQIKKSRLVVILNDMFERPDGLKLDVMLNRGRAIKPNEWYHFVMSYDRITGKLAKYINRDEEEVQYMTENGKPFGGVFIPTFGKKDIEGEYNCLDAPAAYIGKNYSGLIDEFRISYKKIEDLEKEIEIAGKNYKNLELIDRIPVNIEGVITSPVYIFPSTGTKVISFQWDEILPNDTFIWMEFRIYDNLFYENDNDYKWYILKNNQKNIYLRKDEKGEYLRGKHYQWRAHLVASPEGKRSPVLYNVNLNYIIDLPPSIPQFLEITNVGDRSVELSWKKNVESDIYGYRIYYGIMPDKFDGILSYSNGKRISNSVNEGNYIKIIINDSMIQENKTTDRRGLLNFPFLRNNVLYYFSVSAYDSYKPDTQFNHESDPSKKVSARPFSPSEIDLR